MDPFLELESRRLLVSAALTTQARRRLGSRRIAPEIGATDLLSLARKLDEGTDAIERAYRLRFEPPYPGLTAGPEAVGDGLRILLACRAFDHEERPLGVVFTALIPGRLPQVSVAPAEAGIPEDWRPAADLL